MQGLRQVIVTRDPNVVLVSLDLPGLNGSEGIRELRRLNPMTKIIVLSRSANEQEELEMLRMGARGYCGPVEAEVLLKIAEKVQLGEVWAGRRTIGALLEEFYGVEPPPDTEKMPLALLEKLTAREGEIFRLLADGASNKEIASELNIAVSTIKAHLTKIFRKLGQSDRVHLALLAAAARAHIRAGPDENR
jgi:DNA-binding NarL/FixJ family response regulator